MNLPTAIPTPNQTRPAALSKTNVLVSVAGLVLLGAVAWLAWQIFRPIPLPGTPATAEQIEAQFGIRLQHVAVLADGGLIDFRFQVIDPDKASPLFSLDNRPLLFVEATGAKIDSLYHPPHGHNILAGQSSYFIYNNLGGAITPGASISIVFGDLRLEHFSVAK